MKEEEEKIVIQSHVERSTGKTIFSGYTQVTTTNNSRLHGLAVVLSLSELKNKMPVSQAYKEKFLGLLK